MRNAALLILALAPGLGACDEEVEEPALSGACELAAASAGCPECDDGPVACAFDVYEARATSCGDCQARSRLYQTLCDEEVAAPAATIEAGTVCSPVVCTPWIDGCTDPCVRLCSAERDVPEDTCPTECAGEITQDRDGTCQWVGAGCGFE